jgi:transcriptional regulator with GAF, ATPase, and Fis domain
MSAPPTHSDATEPMQLRPRAPADSPDRAGLVLLYAADPTAFAPAYVLPGREVVVGRAAEADLRVPAEAVSRQHARLRPDGKRWVLTDLGGRNGTIVNGRFVRTAVLADLDEVRFGDAIFKFVEHDAAGYARHRIDGALVDPATGVARRGRSTGRIVGGYQIERLVESLRPVARSALSVMLLGESGTGKEVFAEQIHDWSGRSGPFQAVNCAAIPTTLIEGELFGHKRGAFSGADRDRLGLIRAAEGGTLFLDEIGDMPLEAQAKLLRVIQAKEVTPVGASQAQRVDVRIVCATHRDLRRMQEAQQFRPDLFARLNEHSVTIPPLRRRKEDLALLCLALAARHGRPDVQLTLPFMAGLIHHDFPYNVRELEALIKRWAAVTTTGILDADALGEAIEARMATYGRRDEEAPTPDPDPAPEATQPLAPGAMPTEAELRALLAAHRGNLAAIGRLLGRDRAQIHRWAIRHGIKVGTYR